MTTTTLIYPNPIKDNHYFVMDMKEFISQNHKVSISREDFYSYLLQPLDADKVSDETMQAIAEEIDDVMYNEHHYGKDELDLFFHNIVALGEANRELLEDIDDDFWMELELIAVKHNMPYCNK